MSDLVLPGEGPKLDRAEIARLKEELGLADDIDTLQRVIAAAEATSSTRLDGQTIPIGPVNTDGEWTAHDFEIADDIDRRWE